LDSCGARKHSQNPHPAGRLGLGNTAGARKYSQSRDVWGACRPSLGLGNPAGAEILEGDVWRALKNLGNPAGAEVLEGGVWRALKSVRDVVVP